MMSDEEFLRSIEELLDLGSGATDKEIEQNAFKFIKSQEDHLPDKFLFYRDTGKRAIFIIGKSGLAKTGISLNISKNEKIDIIDPDDIKKICPLYSGQNSHLFQKASLETISILMNNIFKEKLSFIFNDNLQNQKKYLNEAVKFGYRIEIIFLHTGKNIDDQYISLIKSTEKILNDYDIIFFKYIDLPDHVILKNQEAKEKLVSLSKIFG